MTSFRYALPFLLFGLLLAGCDILSSEDEPEYTQATITSVLLLDMPSVQPENGRPWDGPLGRNPDVYFGLFDGNADAITFGTTYDNASSFPLTWGVNHTVYNLDEPLGVAFWDRDDLNNDEVIGGKGFVLSDYKDDAPQSFTLSMDGGARAKVTLEWSE